MQYKYTRALFVGAFGILLLSAIPTQVYSQSFPTGAKLYCSTVDPSGTCRLTNNGATAGASLLNCVNLPTNTSYALTVDIVAIDITTVANTTSWNDWTMLLTTGGSAATTVLSTATKPTPLTNGTVTGTGISATADTTIGCLNLTFTSASAGDGHTWDVSAKVSVTQVN